MRRATTEESSFIADLLNKRNDLSKGGRLNSMKTVDNN